MFPYFSECGEGYTLFFHNESDFIRARYILKNDLGFDDLTDLCKDYPNKIYDFGSERMNYFVAHGNMSDKDYNLIVESNDPNFD